MHFRAHLLTRFILASMTISAAEYNASMELEKCLKMPEDQQPKCIGNVRQKVELVHIIKESQFKAKQFQFMVEDRNAAIDIIELPMLKIDLSDVRSIFVGYVVIFAIIGVSILQCCQPTMQSPLFVIAAYVISMTAVLIYLISQAKSTSQILLPTFVVAEIAMIAFAIFISFRFENENRPLKQVWRLQNANAGPAAPPPIAGPAASPPIAGPAAPPAPAPQMNAGAAGQLNPGAPAGRARGGSCVIC